MIKQIEEAAEKYGDGLRCEGTWCDSKTVGFLEGAKYALVLAAGIIDGKCFCQDSTHDSDCPSKEIQQLLYSVDTSGSK